MKNTIGFIHDQRTVQNTERGWWAYIYYVKKEGRTSSDSCRLMESVIRLVESCHILVECHE